MKKIIANIININLPTVHYVQFVRYLIVGIFTASLDFLTLYVLVHNNIIGYFISAAIGFLLGSSLNYFISIKWVFYSGKFKSRAGEFALFIILTSIGLLINQLVMYMSVSIFEMYYMLAKVLSLVVVTVYNYSFKKYMVFVK